MLEAAAWGLVGASSLLIGAALASAHGFSKPTVGLIMAFGAGTLVSAVAFELTEEAFALGGADTVAAGLAAGALTFFFVSTHLAEDALFVGAVLDGIPESAVIGLTVLEGGEVGIAFLAAVFISNLPESLASSSEDTEPTRETMWRWGKVVLVSGVAAMLGYALLDGASDDLVGLIQALAGGGVLCMLSTKMFPEAMSDEAGRSRERRGVIGLMTTLGFACAYLLSTLN